MSWSLFVPSSFLSTGILFHHDTLCFVLVSCPLLVSLLFPTCFRLVSFCLPAMLATCLPVVLHLSPFVSFPLSSVQGSCSTMILPQLYSFVSFCLPASFFNKRITFHQIYPSLFPPFSFPAHGSCSTTTCFLFVSHVSLTCLSLVSHLSLTCLPLFPFISVLLSSVKRFRSAMILRANSLSPICLPFVSHVYPLW